MAVPLQHLPRPRRSFIQWHITERCNLRCKHCYQTSYNTPEINLDGLINIFNQYLELLKLWGIQGRIQFTGGEPFVRKDDLLKMLELCSENRNLITEFGVMSNGYFVTRQIARKLKELGISFFQVSLEGTEKVNNIIRGEGSYKRILWGAKILVEEGIHTVISFTSSKTNFTEFAELVKVGKEIGADTVWTDRLVPWGVGKGMQNAMLSPNEVKTFYGKIDKMAKELSKSGSKTHVPTSRTLYFLATGDSKRHFCDAVGLEGLTILPNGDVLPCRRLPIKVGNLTEQPLFEIWYSADWLWRLRNKNNFKNPICGKCQFFEQCGGGAPCVAYGYSGNPFATDPQCWHAFKELPTPEELAGMTPMDTVDEMEPQYWNNLVVPAITGDLGSHFEIFNDETFFVEEGKKSEIIKITSLNEEIEDKKILLEIDISNPNFDQIKEKLKTQMPEKLFLSFKTSNRIANAVNKEKIIKFLEELKSYNINFVVTDPILKEFLGPRYFFYSKRFNLPKSWKDSLNLFVVNNKFIELPAINKKGPRIDYIKDRNQIFEYFNFFYEKGAIKLPDPPKIADMQKISGDIIQS